MNTNNTIELQLIQSFCYQKSIQYDLLMSKSRKEPFVFYRHCLMYVMKMILGLKEEYIASIMKCTHGNVNIMTKKIKGFIDTKDIKTIKTTNQLKEIISQFK